MMMARPSFDWILLLILQYYYNRVSGESGKYQEILFFSKISGKNKKMSPNQGNALELRVQSLDREVFVSFYID